MIKRLFLYISLYVFLSHGIENANSEEVSESSESQDRSGLDQYSKSAEGSEGKQFGLSSIHRAISESLETLIKRTDSLFDNDNDNVMSTKSYTRTRLLGHINTNGEFGIVNHFNINIDLPKLKHRVKLLFESNADEPDEIENRISTVETTSVESDDTTHFAGVRGVVTHTNIWKISLDAGAGLKSPIDPFVRARVRRFIQFERSIVNIQQTFFHFGSTRFGSEMKLAWDYLLSYVLLLRLESKVRWTQGEGNFSLSQQIELSQGLYDPWGLRYQAGLLEHMPNWSLTHYFIRVRYRHKIYQSWLFLEAGPELYAENSTEFALKPVVWIGLEMNFGDKFLF